MSAKWSGFAKTMRVKEAQELFFPNIKYLPKIEEVETKESNHRILATKIISKINLPGFRRSAMDGYAVIAEDTYGATETSPLQLEIAGKSEIGDTNVLELLPNQAIRISTGAPVPKNATAVIKIENCEEIDKKTLEIYTSVAIGLNISEHDEDVKENETLFEENHLLEPWDIALIESIGLTKIKVFDRPKIITLSTGNELLESGSKPNIGQVIDSNRPALNAWIKSYNCEIPISEMCDDDVEKITEKILNFADNCDLIITTGGTSVGTRDYLPEIIEKIGELWIHGVAIRPGKPLGLGFINGNSKKTPIIALPGYPLAALINFYLFGMPIISNWTKLPLPFNKIQKVKLKQKVPSKAGVMDFVRLRKTDEGAELIRITGAGIMSSFTRADYLLMVPEDSEGYDAGEIVEVRVIRNE